MGRSKLPNSFRKNNKIVRKASKREEKDKAWVIKQSIDIILRRFIRTSHMVITYRLHIIHNTFLTSSSNKVYNNIVHSIYNQSIKLNKNLHDNWVKLNFLASSLICISSIKHYEPIHLVNQYSIMQNLPVNCQGIIAPCN